MQAPGAVPAAPHDDPQLPLYTALCWRPLQLCARAVAKRCVSQLPSLGFSGTIPSDRACGNRDSFGLMTMYADRNCSHSQWSPLAKLALAQQCEIASQRYLNLHRGLAQALEVCA